MVGKHLERIEQHHELGDADPEVARRTAQAGQGFNSLKVHSDLLLSAAG